MKQLILGLVLTGLLVPAVSAQTVPLYVNNGTVTSAVDIDATTFVNIGSFTDDSHLFSTANTLNYTNTGTMSSAIGFDLEYFLVPQPFGVESPQMAANFYNSGTIHAGFNLIVAATNLSSPGYFDLAFESNLKLTGQNLDLTRSTLVMPQTDSFSTKTVASLDYGKGTCPVTTNVSWVPAFDLGSTYANSATFTNRSRQRLQMYLFNSTPYYDVKGAGTTNVIIRAVFLQNNNTNVTTRVYLRDDVGGIDGAGAADLEWAGPYVDTRTGQSATNYFYLSTVMRTTTNANFINGIPSNYTFSQNQGTPLYSGMPHPIGLPPGAFPSGAVTNNTYAYVKAQAIGSSTATNSVTSVANLPGRIQISASNSLELALAQIATPNYLLLDCTNNFRGHDGTDISAAYGDIRLGVTNGFLTLSNLWRPELPRWAGTVEAWNTRWFVTVGSTNYDFRVLIVDSALYPTVPTYVQNLLTRSTNSLLVSDTFNIFGDLSIDASVLTLTTNGFGHGAASLAGELNLSAPNFSWAAATPRLRWLTNDGAIRMTGQLLQNFGNSSPGSNYLAFVNRGQILDADATIWAGEFQNYGSFVNQYGSFALNSTNATLFGGTVTAINDVTFNTGTLNTSNLLLQAGRSLVLNVTNVLTDNGVNNSNVWNVGSSVGLVGNAGNGFMLPARPPVADLLGTTISSIAPGPNKKIYNLWSGADRGAIAAGYTNNAAVGWLALDAQGSLSQFAFNPRSGETNALYVDCLELRNYTTNRDGTGNFYVAISNHPNFIIYYAQALIGGVSYAEKLNHKNNDRLRWVSSYAGRFSSTNLVYGGTTNTVNAALAASTAIDSDGDGIVNAQDPTPFFLPSQLNLTITLTNSPPPLKSVLKWTTFPNATNYVYFRTNLMTANWQLLTNFISPLPYPSAPAPVTITDPVNPTVPRYYRVQLAPQQP